MGVDHKKFSRDQPILDKTRMVDTTQGQVPLRRGKYGMDVEEYLEWKSSQSLQYRYERLQSHGVDWEAIDAKSK